MVKILDFDKEKTVPPYSFNKNEIIPTILENKEFNKTLCLYYNHLSEDIQINFNSRKKIESIDYCNSYWLVDFYKHSKIKDVKNTNLCRDRFCSNCKKVKQSAEISKYLPVFEKDKNDLYLFTLTIPNCKITKKINSNIRFSKIDTFLKRSIDLLNRSFKKMVRLFNGNLKTDLLPDLNYFGALKSIEITYNKEKKEFHPHIHAIFKIKDFENYNQGFNINKFSYSRNSDKCISFSDFEIAIQKIWYLIINGQYLTKNNYDNLEVGYSCKIDKIDKTNVFEVFKYNIKDTDLLDNGYLVFRDIYISTYRKKFIQGYGDYYSIKEINNEELDKYYYDLIERLKLIESPKIENEDIKDILKDTENLYISKNKIRKYIELNNLID